MCRKFINLLKSMVFEPEKGERDNSEGSYIEEYWG